LIFRFFRGSNCFFQVEFKRSRSMPTMFGRDSCGFYSFVPGGTFSISFGNPPLKRRASLGRPRDFRGKEGHG
jgi:hypothetical protein